MSKQTRAKMRTCEEINNFFQWARSMAFKFTTTTEAIASKNYWPLQDMKQLVMDEAPLQSMDRSCLNNIQANITRYRADLY